MVLIRPWTKADIDFVLRSVNSEGWGYSRRDIERCWRFEPDGCFIAEAQNQPIGHVSSITYDRIGWIGLLVVSHENRGRGIGQILMRTAIDYLRDSRVHSIHLESVQKAIPLYRLLGFREEFESLRLCKQLTREEKAKLKEVTKIPCMQEEDLEKVAEFDSKHFGANRFRVLRALYEYQPQHCFVSRGKQKIKGYIMCRKMKDSYWIGPWVCENRLIAKKLCYKCLTTVNEERTKIRLGLPVPNEEGMKLMQELGFQLSSKSVRMVLGEEDQGSIEGIYAIAGPEKG